MYKMLIGCAALVVVMAVTTAPADAESLWSDTSSSLFSDVKALNVGDIVTIVVNEQTSASQNSATEVQQQETMDSSTGDGILGTFLEQFGIEASDQYETDGTTESGSSLVTTVSAEVVEVLPNGNLVIEARRKMVVNHETQTMVLTGVVRRADVTRDNRISSGKIANLDLRYEGKGSISKRQKPGLLNKLFDMIF